MTKTFTKQVLYSYLCYYNKKNPYYDENFNSGDLKSECFCDACFYGKSDLVEYILYLQEQVDFLTSYSKDQELIIKEQELIIKENKGA